MRNRGQGPSAASPAGPDVPAPRPQSPLDAAAAAARAPNPIPDTSTSKASLESNTRWIPPPLQPVAMVAVGLGKAAWTVAVPMARIAYRLVVWSSPVLIWAGMKYVNWYVFGWLAKFTRFFSWGKWLLSWLPLAKGAPPA